MHCRNCCASAPPQEQRNILAIAVGLRGIAAIRAVLNWAPVQAHATSHKVSCFYVTKSPSSAAFLAEWDQWREAGVSAGCTNLVCRVHIYLRPNQIQVIIGTCFEMKCCQLGVGSLHCVCLLRVKK
jgi:hypothetical protein